MLVLDMGTLIFRLANLSHSSFWFQASLQST
jgi:hypothetical protein